MDNNIILNMSTTKAFRQQIAEENEQLVHNNTFKNKTSSQKFNLSTTINKAYLNDQGKIMIFSGYTDCAIEYFSRLNKKVCALNFANATTPGGGYMRGALAQEEELCRQYPTLHVALHNMKYKYDQYPLKFGELIYTKNVQRNRKNYKNNYNIIDQPTLSCDFITCACPNLNRRLFIEILPKEQEHITKSIDLMFKVGINNDVRILILGAWGCGAFSPVDNVSPLFTYTNFIANEFKKISQLYLKCFDIIVFAVPTDDNGNVFMKVFKN
jgi:uncharacterized protein (TIGR02452 family)